MRLLTVSLLAAAMLLLSAANASAYRIFWANYTGPANAASDTISVEIHLDTEGASNVLLCTVGVVFDDAVLEYVPGSSDAADYPLWQAASGATPSTWLEPAIPFGGTNYDPPQEIVPGQINVDQHAYNLVATSQVSADEFLATLTFHVIDGVASIPADSVLRLTIDGTEGGTVFQLGDNSKPTVALASPISVPEPTLAGLSLAALIALYGIHTRRRSA